MTEKSASDPNDRREFVKKALAVLLGTASVAVPAGAGLAVLLDPIRRPSRETGFIKIAKLDDLPPAGIPKRFKVVSSRSDAWTRHSESPIGAVFLMRKGAEEVEAFNVTCPHAGCAVNYMPQGPGLAGADSDPCFFCPCHNSSFALNGTINDPASPSPRGLDSLPVEVRGTEVWVHFQNFLTARREKIPVT